MTTRCTRWTSARKRATDPCPPRLLAWARQYPRTRHSPRHLTVPVDTTRRTTVQNVGRVGAGLTHYSNADGPFTSIYFAEALVLKDIAAPIGSMGDAYDNAQVESSLPATRKTDSSTADVASRSVPPQECPGLILRTFSCRAGRPVAGSSSPPCPPASARRCPRAIVRATVSRRHPRVPDVEFDGDAVRAHLADLPFGFKEVVPRRLAVRHRVHVRARVDRDDGRDPLSKRHRMGGPGLAPHR